MNQKSRIGLNALWLMGLIYAGVGAVFLIVGLVLIFQVSEGKVQQMGIGYCVTGGIFLVLGLIFIFLQLAKKRRNDRLLEAGRYVWAEVIACDPNLLVTFNRRHPYIATLRHTDANGNSRLFKSGSLNIRDPQPLLGRQVRVYIDSAKPSHYYVDADALLGSPSLL